MARGDFGEFQRERERKKSTTFRARIEGVNPDGSYQVQREDTGQIVRAEWGNRSIALAVGQYVVAMRTDMSGSTHNVGNIILHPHSTNSRNSSDSQRYTNDVRHVAATVSVIKSGGVIVSRVTLHKGGAAVVVLIHGENFSADPTYGNAGITNDIAVVRTSTLITIQVEASGGMAVGLYSLTVGTHVIPDFFEVVP